LKLRLQIVEARAPTDLASAVASAAKASAEALLVPGDPMFTGQLTRIAELARTRRLPLMASQSEYAEAGALLAYGTDHRDSFRRAATFVDRILKGAKPADLPVEQATKFELTVNSRTAKAMGIVIAPAVVSRADRIIE
jgi:putative ABC transport system substrate-binding protein